MPDRKRGATQLPLVRTLQTIEPTLVEDYDGGLLRGAPVVHVTVSRMGKR